MNAPKTSSTSSRKILLLGLEDASLAQLADILALESHEISSQPLLPVDKSLDLIDRFSPDVVYCVADPEHYSPLVEAVRGRGSGLPVVVVSRESNVSEWLDAIEAGAWDYVALPFETAHLRHVLENALRCADVHN
jgi:DNA-binding NtrC family response regulator